MTDYRPHWLELAEYVTLGLALISLLASLGLGIGFLPLLFLTLTLGLNIINRLRWQASSRKRMTGTLRQFQSEWEAQKDALSGQITALSPDIRQDNAKSISALQENILALEQSLNGITHYLNHHALRERVEHLEKSYGQLRKDVLSISDSPESALSSPLEANEAKIVLPSLNLTASPPDLVLPHWHYLRQIEAHGESIAAIALTGDERFLVSVSWDRCLKVWDFPTGNLIQTIEAHDQGILALAVMGSGDYHIATGGFDQTVKLWVFQADFPSLQLNQIFLGHLGSIHALGFIAHSRLLVSGSYDRMLKQWPLDNETESVSSHDTLGAIYALAIAERGEFIASGGGDGTITLWKVGSGEKLAILTGNVSSVKTVAISNDEKTIGAGCLDGTVKLWNYSPNQETPGKPIRAIDAHQGQVTSLVFANNGEWLLTGGTDGQIQVWNPHYQQSIVTLSVSSPISCLALSADGGYLIAGCSDGTLTIFDLIA